MPTDITVGELGVTTLLRRMAAKAQESILRRAFPAEGRARDVEGRPVKPLSEGYRWYKSGTRPYKSPETKARATLQRARSGKPGRGPLVNLVGIRTRLAPRKPSANQRLTDHTAKGLGVIREVPGQSITLGFRDSRSQEVAGHLEERNNFWGLDEKSRAEVVDLARKALGDFVETIQVSGKTEIRIKVGK
jgi:hypothetical protein